MSKPLEILIEILSSEVVFVKCVVGGCGWAKTFGPYTRCRLRYRKNPMIIGKSCALYHLQRAHGLLNRYGDGREERIAIAAKGMLWKGRRVWRVNFLGGDRNDQQTKA